jgi:hypothetical protein
MVKAWVVLYVLFASPDDSKLYEMIAATHEGCLLNIQIMEIYDIGSRKSKCFQKMVTEERYKAWTDPEYLPSNGVAAPSDLVPNPDVGSMKQSPQGTIVCDDILKRAGLCNP